MLVLSIEREGGLGKGLEVGIGHRNVFPKRILCHIFAEGKVGGPGVDVMKDEKRSVSRLPDPGSRQEPVPVVKMRRAP